LNIAFFGNRRTVHNESQAEVGKHIGLADKGIMAMLFIAGLVRFSLMHLKTTDNAF
jgi:hypothetical protein